MRSQARNILVEIVEPLFLHINDMKPIHASVLDIDIDIICECNLFQNEFSVQLDRLSKGCGYEH